MMSRHAGRDGCYARLHDAHNTCPCCHTMPYVSCRYQLLPVQLMENDLSSEKLLLALVNSRSSKLLTRASIPLAALQPHRHYNLRLGMAGTYDETSGMSFIPPWRSLHNVHPGACHQSIDTRMLVAERCGSSCKLAWSVLHG